MDRKVFGIALGLWVMCTGLLFALQPKDLAQGKKWRQSSVLPYPDSPHFFFHTLDDDNPWVEIDLGEPTTFSRVTVVNRRDEGLQHRAVPLVLEAGDDQQSWKQLARRDEVFDTWEAKFEPVKARYVRARAARKTFLHLEAVKVHP